MKKICVLTLSLLVCTTAFAISAPTKAMAYSAFIPGGGQIYNKAYAKAGLVIAVQGYLVGSIIYDSGKAKEFQDKSATAPDAYTQHIYQQKAKDYKARKNSNIWWAGLTTVLSILDAYVDAHLADFEEQKEKLHLELKGDGLSLQYKF